MSSRNTPRIRSSVGLLTVATLVIGPAVAPAQADATVSSTKTEQITVPATLEFRQGQNPNAPGNCSAPVFVQWKDVPGTTSATAYYTTEGGEKSATSTPPFDDTTEWIATYTVQPGYHWIYINGSSRAGPLPSTCEDLTAKHRTIFTTPVRVVLTVEKDNSKCAAAGAAADKAAKRVKRLRNRLQDATGQKRIVVKQQLRKARSQLARARDRQQRLC